MSGEPTGAWPDRLVDLGPHAKGQLMARDPDRYFDQVLAERQAEDRRIQRAAESYVLREERRALLRFFGPPIVVIVGFTVACIGAVGAALGWW